ncbi:MAG: tetratricopeptide repeat protein, partial [Bacteroidetes bacterium]|nr:tetratricopeptide repeat protein [Bacteroidota bacterium]
MYFVLFSSCSQKKNTFTSRLFHSLTAHYNGLYWANVNMEEGIFNIERAHKDDYAKILPLFKYGDEKVAKANYPPFDKAIEKTNKVIQWHSMLIDGTEHARWIDQNYLTLGKAHFYKRDYYSAVTVFEYVVKVFPNKPSRYDAFLWLVRSYNQMNSVIKTGPILDFLKHDEHLPKRLKGEYAAVLSDYNLRTEQYDKAEESLVKAIKEEKKKTVRGRYWYILAQLYEQDGDLQKASGYYALSAKLHPGYEMEFNARLAKARTFQVGNGDAKELKKELIQMLKDAKNKEYRDQIYYALGDISYRENDFPTALKYFKNSALSSTINTRQKGISYLRAADIYFDQKNYKPAQAYYDSTMAFLPKEYKNYDLIKNKHTSLTAMIKDISTISHEDSLLQVAEMDTAKISKLIDEIIARLTLEEEKKKKEDEAKAGQPKSSTTSNENNPWQSQNQTGTWYFYNQSTIGFGFTEFFKKWGNRPLEDNWRRSSKEMVIAEQQIDTAKKDTSSGSKKIAENKTHKYYLKNIPFTDEQKANSKFKIVDAYYDLGGIYKEDLQDNQKAAETFEELLKKYPDNKYTLNLYYQLYRLYMALDDTREEEYKNKILNEHPESEYAKIILNPDYQKALLASKNEIEKFYGETFSAYKGAQYEQVIAMANRADTFYSASALMPKFALLRAYSIGKTKGADDYEKALQGVMAKYPKDPAKAKAQELLDHLK